MEKEPYKIGQLVAIRNHPYFDISDKRKKGEKSENRYIGSTITCSSDNYPLMLIKEYTQSIETKKQFNKSTSAFNEDSKLNTKYLCSWYDSKLGCFQEAWFLHDLLIPFPLVTEESENLILLNESEIPLQAFLKTTIIERYKTIKNQARENDRFVSSSFLLKGKRTEDQYEWFNKEYGFMEKSISKIKVNLKWFNVIKGKYTEEWLPIEFFKATPDLIEKKWDFLDDADKSFNIDTSKRLMDYLNDGNNSYFIHHNLSGKNLGTLIFYYLYSNRKIILDDRIQALDEYLNEKRYTVEKYNISVNSEGIPHFKSFYSPIDIIVKVVGKNEYFTIDVISGNSLIKDGEITQKLKPLSEKTSEENENEIVYDNNNELSLYNGRAFIVQNLLKEKYNYLETKSKLLIINNRLDNIIQEFDAIECPISINKVTEM